MKGTTTMGMERLTLQQMIDSVLESAQPGAMAKLAEEANGDAQDKGEGEKKDKRDLERKADSEESQQGGGSPESSQEKTATSRIAKLAAAVDEIVASLTGQPMPSSVGKVAAEDAAAPNVGPGKGPGATQTNLETPVSGEQPATSGAASGQAKTQIPSNPPMEAGDNPKAPKNALQTNESMQHPAQPEAGVMKQGSVAAFAAALLNKKAAEFSPEEAAQIEQAAAERAAKWGRIGGGIASGLQAGGYGAIAGAEHAGLKGALAGGLGGAVLGSAAGAGIGHLVGKHISAPLATQGVGEAGETHMWPLLLDPMGTLGARQGAREQVAALRAAKGGAQAPAQAPTQEKTAEDAINPAQISAPKSTTLPEDQPSKMARPAEVTSQERHVASNEAPAATQPVDAAAVPKKRMAEVLDEPMQTAATDKVLDSVLGSSVVNQAGAKIASMNKTAEARAWLAKIASEGCKCGPEKGTCQFCKLASRLGKGEKGSEERGQLGTPPVGAGSSSPGGKLAGGDITPSM